MPRASSLFLRATIVLACLATISLFLPGDEEADAGVTTRLRPDLTTRRPNHVLLERAGQVDLLRFSNEIVNRGRGPLEMRPEGDCDGDPATRDRIAFQRVFRDSNVNGVFDRGPDSAVERYAGCTRFHPEHDHWHFDDFALYELLEIESDGTLGEVVASSEKVGFCLLDTSHLKPHLPSSPPAKYYGKEGTQCDEDDPTGISIGWSDLYGALLYHQWIVVTDVPDGDYCLRSTADPNNNIAETRNGNNSNSIAIELDGGRVDYKPRRPCT